MNLHCRGLSLVDLYSSHMVLVGQGRFAAEEHLECDFVPMDQEYLKENCFQEGVVVVGKGQRMTVHWFHQDNESQEDSFAH